MHYLILLLILTAAAIAAPAQTFTNTTSIAVPSTGTTSGVASPYSSNITVSGVVGTVNKVTVSLRNLSHTFPDDIDVLLVGPTGAKMLLMSDTGGSLDVNNVTLTFDDTAAVSLPDSTQITTGTFKPTNIGAGDTFAAPAPAAPYAATLSTFNNLNPNGTWSLYILDDTAGDAGTMALGWSLTIQTMPTAANVSISGRVLTEDGRGIFGARILMTGINGETRVAISNHFGFYRFEGVVVGENYVISAVHKIYQFSPQIISPTDEISNLTITALP